MKDFLETQELESLINRCRKGVIIGHYNPDGDSVGSITAMHHYLSARGIETSLVLPSDYPAYLEFMNPAGNKIHIYYHQKSEVKRLVEEADALFCLDFNKLSRTEWMEELIAGSSAEKVLIDHHPFPQIEAFNIIFSKTDISSACELLYHVLMSMPDIAGDVNKLPIECANSLYTGMMTDTNNFSNSVYPSTYEMASNLVSRGVDREKLFDNVFNFYSEERMRLMGHLLKEKLQVIPECNAAYIMLSAEEKLKYNFAPGDAEGFVNLPLSIRGVKMSALFSENALSDTPHIRVSLRSKGDFMDVNKFSGRYFNGGGHKNASGGRLYIPFDKVGTYFEESLKDYLLSLQDV